MASSASKPRRSSARVHKQPSRDSMDLPERYRNMDTDDDDEDDGTGIGDTLPQQSVYGLLAATQSKANHPSRFEQDSESESEGEEARREAKVKKSRDRQTGHRRDEGDPPPKQTAKSAKGGERPPEDRIRPQGGDPMTQSQILPSRTRTESPIERPASVPADKPVRKDSPLLGRKLQAMAKAEEVDSTASASDRTSMDQAGREQTPQTQADAIASIFKFEQPEEVVSQSPCWYLQNVLLEGEMYITEKHICFYSHLKTKNSSAVKTGRLSKRGHRSITYKPYHFVLKGDIFSYYRSAAEPYSPVGMLDLRNAISADITPEKDGGDGTYFTVTTDERDLYYRADNAASAKDWIKALRHVIFRKNNAANTVKISLRIKDVRDVEQANVMEGADTVKLRVESSEFAIDEYFFSFFDLENNPIELLRSFGQKSNVEAAHTAGKVSMSQPGPKSNARATVGSPHAKSAAQDIPPRFGKDRRSSGSSNEARRICRSPISRSLEESTESFITSSEQPSDSANEDSMDANMSASQMLFDDGVFHRPTLRRPQPRTVEEVEDESEDSSRAPSADRSHVRPASQRAADMVSRPKQDLKHKASSGSGKTTITSDESHPPTSQPPSRGGIVRGISTPIATVAGIVRSSGKAVGSYLSSSPGSYVSNWSNAIAGGKRHYMKIEGLAPDDSVPDPENEHDVEEHTGRFRQHFGLPDSEKLQSVFFCWLHRTIPVYGKIYLGTRHFCFRGMVYGTNSKVILPYSDITTVQKTRGFRWGSDGLVIVIRGHEELFFDFDAKGGLRDEVTTIVLRTLEKQKQKTKALEESTILTKKEQDLAAAAAAEDRLLEKFRKTGHANKDRQIPPSLDASTARPIIFDGPDAEVLDFTPKQPLRITCLTIGSRGDVQPYVALCKGLKAQGHKPKIATHAEFKGFVEEHGIEFAEVAGDPAVLMKLCVDNGMFSPKFFMEVNKNFRGWLQELLESAWIACQGSDVLIESPSAMCGLHIAEALEIPYFRAFTMPWTRTRAYPHAFSVPGDNKKRGGAYNYMTYTFFDSIFWGMTSGQINKWRSSMLGIGPTGLDRMNQHRVPFLYNFSPNVVIPPLDFSPWIHVTGYWFLDTSENYQPPQELAAFIKKAKDEDQKLVYIGFGSVTVQDSKLLMQQIVNAVIDAGVRCVLAKGWSDRMDKDTTEEVEMPASIFQIKAAPHDWLFAQMDAVVHHGGAGTTGASLRAGKPTLIRPFFGDQFFFASRVTDLGVGAWLGKLSAKILSKALWLATHDRRLQDQAKALGEAIRAEDGVKTAINALYREMDHAKGMIKKSGKKKYKVTSKDGAQEADTASLAEISDTEENWTFLDSSGMEIADVEERAGADVTATVPSKGKGKQPATSSAATK